MAFFRDQLGREIDIPHLPQRIVSLVPSQTELLYDLGLGERIVGITKFCVHPNEWFRTRVRIGGTKTIHIEKVLSLQPDLILANKEENVKEQIETLSSKVPLWVSDVNNLEDTCSMITGVGAITGTDDRATEMVNCLKAKFSELEMFVQSLNNIYRGAYLIWKDPYMAAGGDTFINDMLTRCGWQNVFVCLNRYPSITVSQLKAAGANLILLSSEPYPFKEKHITEIQSSLPEAKVLLVDGEMFSWYGSRLLKAADYFKQLLNTSN